MTSTTRFARLFEAGCIGHLDLKNRLCMAPIGTRYADDDGFVTGRQIDFYAERARGGVGLIIVEATYIHPYPGRMLISADKFIPGLARLTDAIHEGGAKASIEIQTRRGRSDSSEPMGPSPVAHPRTGAMPKVVTKSAIAQMTEAFSSAAKRAQDAGFDSIQIHGGSGYLLNEFLSPLANNRTDEYGGSLENRARLAIEIVARVREKVGPDFPVIYRQCADERVAGGIPPDEAVAFSRMLERGGVNAIEVVSGSTVHSPEWIVMPLGLPPGANVHLAAAIRNAVSIPIIVGGKLDDPVLAEEVLRTGKADFISIGKALIADPAFAQKIMTGRIEEIRPCINCLHCTDPRIRDNVGIRCTTNPSVGQENVYPIRPATSAKRIAVVGGGPAGIQAALVLAQRGHRVMLLERQVSVGGDLLLDTFSPYVEESSKLLAYFERELAKWKVDVQTGIEVTCDSKELSDADVIVVATGGRPIVPPIPGIGGANVATYREVLAGDATVGQQAIVLGSGLMACKAALYLRRAGKLVTLLERNAVFGSVMEETIRRVTVERLHRAGIRMEAGIEAIGFDGDGVKCANASPASRCADMLIVALGLEPHLALYTQLMQKGVAVYAMGECVRPGTLAGPIQLAFQESFEIL